MKDSIAAMGAPPSRERVRRYDGDLLMVGAGVLLGTIGIFSQEAAQDPATTVWFRCAFGLATLLAWALATGRLDEMTGLRGRALAAVLGAGTLMITSWGLFFAAIPLCSIAVSTVVFHLQPFWLLALASVVLRERVSAVQWTTATVALAGLALASGIGDQGAAWRPRGDYLLGLALSFAGSLVYAGVGLIVRAEGERVGSLAMAVGPCVAGTALLMPWPGIHGWPSAGPSWWWLGGLGVLHTGLAYVLLYAGMARLGAGRIAALQFVYPATAVLVDWIVYGHALSTTQLAGLSLIAGALLTLRRFESSEERSA